MMQRNRIQGGLIDRESSIKFKFNGREFNGFKGDTAASALLANDISLIARSFKYHRPRGIFTSDSSEPNAMVEVLDGKAREPNTRVTSIELFDGLEIQSQNCWPSVKYDVWAINDIFSPFISAGFYYKTFMWPKSFWERFYEPTIRRAAGLGALPTHSDPDRYDRGFRHCDILIIGAGPAGIMAALRAGQQGFDVILVDEDFMIGGRLLSERELINGAPSQEWLKTINEELLSMPNVRIMIRTTLFSVFDDKTYFGIERIENRSSKIRFITWEINPKNIFLATGASERHIAFGNNDRPGVMLSGAMRSYLNRFAVAPSSNMLVFTNNNSGWQTAEDFNERKINVAGVIDIRNNNDFKPEIVRNGIPIYQNDQIVKVHGVSHIKAVTLKSGKKIETDGIAVSGGWNPNIHLACHLRNKPIWDEKIAAFVADERALPSKMKIIGAAKGNFSTQEAFQDAIFAVNELMPHKNKKFMNMEIPDCSANSCNIEPFWSVKLSKQRSWVDLQNDVTTKDISLALQEGFCSIEHIKRYTTLGMGTDQGKNSNVLGIGVVSELADKSIQETGTTIYRPPYIPVPIGAFAGRNIGKNFRPTRETPSHKFAIESGAEMIESGAWIRSQYFPKKEENHWRQTVNREVISIRSNVGCIDVSTLGKIDVQGEDAAIFLDKLYCNTISSLRVNKCRYGLMLREDGIVMDDGTVAHIADNHFIVTTTTANATLVYRHMEFCKQCLWPDLDVSIIPVTEQWAQYAIAGPNSRKFLEDIVDSDVNIANDNFPYMHCSEITICNGMRARLFRLSFSGELAYEIAVPARYGDSLIRLIHKLGQKYHLTHYGTESLGVMRIEKGHISGGELNGQTTMLDLGLARMVNKNKDSIGNKLSDREGLADPSRPSLVGIFSKGKENPITSGSHIFKDSSEFKPQNDIGYVSSVAYSPIFDKYIGLAFVKGGNNMNEEKLRAVDLLQKINVEIVVTSPHFYDPDGARLRG